jgi:hypothetical protein
MKKKSQLKCVYFFVHSSSPLFASQLLTSQQKHNCFRTPPESRIRIRNWGNSGWELEGKRPNFPARHNRPWCAHPTRPMQQGPMQMAQSMQPVQRRLCFLWPQLPGHHHPQLWSNREESGWHNPGWKSQLKRYR